MQSFSDKLTWSFTLNTAFVTVHTKKWYHQNTWKNTESYFKHEKLKILWLRIECFPIFLGFIELFITNFRNVWDDWFKEIKSEDRCDYFSFCFPDLLLAECHSIPKKTFHICNVYFLFWKDKDFLHWEKLSNHIGIDKINSNLIHDIVDYKVVPLLLVFIEIERIFVFLKTFHVSLNKRDFERLERKFFNFVSKRLEGIHIEIVKFFGFEHKRIVQVGENY